MISKYRNESFLVTAQNARNFQLTPTLYTTAKRFMNESVLKLLHNMIISYK